MASQSLKDTDQSLEGLFNCPWFYGELSREDATEILNGAVTNDGESLCKRILFLETKQNRFAIMQAYRRKDPDDIQPRFYFSELKSSNWNLRFWWGWCSRECINVVRLSQSVKLVRKNPFSLEILAAVKAATCGFNLETLGLPRMINGEVKKYQDLDQRIKSFE